MQVAHLEKSNHYLTATREQRGAPPYETFSRCVGARSETTRLWLCILPRASRTSRNGSGPCWRSSGEILVPADVAGQVLYHEFVLTSKNFIRTVTQACGATAVVHGGAELFRESLRCCSVCSGER